MGSRFIWAYGKRILGVYVFDKGILSMVLWQLRTSENVLFVYANNQLTDNDDQAPNYRTVLVYVLTEGEVEKSNLDIYAVNLDEPDRNAYRFQIPNFCRCTEALFQVINWKGNTLEVVSQYSRKSLNGTTIVSKRYILSSTNGKKHPFTKVS